MILHGRLSGVVPALGLCASFSTLICCALPTLLISLGGGAALVGLASAMPGLIWFPQNKGIVFGLAGVLIGMAGLVRWKLRNAPCPADSRQAAACRRMRHWGRIAFWASVALYAVGFFFAFVMTGMCSALWGDVCI